MNQVKKVCTSNRHLLIKWILTGLLPVLNLCVQAQQVKQKPAETSLDSLSEEFTEPTFLKSWQLLHTIENFPDKIRSVGIDKGLLSLQPYASGWYGDYQAPFLFKNISGNFDVRTKIKVSGLSQSLPQNEWSLAGLMVRQASPRTSDNWEPRQENWLFFTTGIAEPKSSAVFEVKTTSNSVSNLKLRPAKEGWVELRIVRIQASFILLYRYPSEEWTIIEHFYRPLMPHHLQVGINAYSGWNEIPDNVKRDPLVFNKTLQKEVPTDMLLQVDYIRFSRPVIDQDKLKSFAVPGFRAPYYTLGNLLTDYSITNEQLLQLLN